MVFTRVQLVPRLEGTGELTRLFLEQAFGRIAPIKSAELAISVGKFDSVFGIEYLENQANFRIGITPSLLARYTTGTSTGVKVFYRFQLIAISSAVSINASATNSGTFVEALQGPSRSLTGVPVATARLGYELNLARLSVKLGASVERGPRNDQNDRGAMQFLYGFDLRLFVAGLTLMGEFVKVDEEEGNPNKLTGTGTYTLQQRLLRAGVLAAGRLRASAADRALPDHALRALRATPRRVRRLRVDRGRSPHGRPQRRRRREPDREGRIPGQPRARRGADRRQQRDHLVGGVDMVNGRAAAAAAAVAFWLATMPPIGAAAEQERWLGDELPLPLPVKTPRDITFKAAAERQYLIFNLMAGGKLAYQRGEWAVAVEKWETLLRIAGLDPQVEKAVAPFLADARAKAGLAPRVRAEAGSERDRHAPPPRPPPRPPTSRARRAPASPRRPRVARPWPTARFPERSAAAVISGRGARSCG